MEKLIRVKFVNAKYNDTDATYVFKNSLDDVALNDYVVVETYHGYCVGIVIELNAVTNLNISKRVVCKVDFTALEKAKQEELRIKELRIKLNKLYEEKELKEMLDKIHKDLPETINEITDIDTLKKVLELKEAKENGQNR